MGGARPVLPYKGWAGLLLPGVTGCSIEALAEVPDARAMIEQDGPVITFTVPVRITVMDAND